MNDAAQPVGPDVAELSRTLANAIGQVLVGKNDAVRLALVALFSEGHLLIEDVPGTGKTTLARTLAASTGADFRRIQFTPDLLPTDIIGVNIFDAKTTTFAFRRGPVFAEVVLADEINRATPRTQSALLEAMQEGQVSVDGDTYPLPQPFIVLATQNPVEMDGTFRLPEAQLDRFLLCLSLGYPDEAEEAAMLERYEKGGPAWEKLEPVTHPRAIRNAQAMVRRVPVGENVRTYIRRIAQATRQHEHVRLGVSPRGTLALQVAAQASAAMDAREYVLPDDVKALAPAVLGHRLLIETGAALRGLSGVQVVSELVSQVEVPLERTAALNTPTPSKPAGTQEAP